VASDQANGTPSVRSGRTSALYTLFILSGATSLIFEVIWLRGFAIVLGSTLRSMACVLTAFMLGLTLGNALAARFAGRGWWNTPAKALYWYGAVELAVGVYGAVFTPTLFYWQDGYISWVARLHGESVATNLLVDFSLSTGLLVIPTIAMGATLPILSESLRRDSDTTSLYGFNLFGGALGSLAASFVLIYLVGCIAGAYITAGINAAIFLGALLLARRDEPFSLESGAPRPTGPATSVAPWNHRMVLGLAFFSGTVFFGSELVWNRVFALLLGNRVYVTSVTLGCILACLGLSARWTHGALGRMSPNRLLFLGYVTATVSLICAIALEPWALGSGSEPWATASFMILLVFVPACGMGVVFPALLALPAGGTTRAQHVGRVAALNTLGSVAGLLLTAYVLIPTVGSNLVILANAGLLLACLGVVTLFASAKGQEGQHRIQERRVLVALSLAFTVAVFLFAGRPLGTVAPDRAVVATEDSHCIFEVERLDTGLLRVTCTGTDLVYHFGDPATQYVQETQAHIPLLLAPRVARTLVIGSGYGITAGVFGRYPTVDHVDAVEIIPLMVDHAELFAAGNHGYVDNPKVDVHVTDGRHYLTVAHQPYDVISINVTDPYIPGSASLFSADFYRLVKRRLTDEGVVCQHVFGPDRASLVHGFSAHFRHVRAIPSYGNGLSLIGSDAPLEVQHPETLDHPEVSRMLHDIGIGVREESRDELEELLVRGDSLLADLESEPAAFVNSDAFPALEFRRAAGLSVFHSNL